MVSQNLEPGVFIVRVGGRAEWSGDARQAGFMLRHYEDNMPDATVRLSRVNADGIEEPARVFRFAVFVDGAERYTTNSDEHAGELMGVAKQLNPAALVELVNNITGKVESLYDGRPGSPVATWRGSIESEQAHGAIDADELILAILIRQDDAPTDFGKAVLRGARTYLAKQGRQYFTGGAK